jgi:hypothetical protein
MSDPRWVDGLLPECPFWVRDLVDEELNKRDTRIKELEAFLVKLKGSGEWYRSALEFDTRHVDGEELEAELHKLLQEQGDEH